jgi:hypothetical protein
MSPAHDPDLSLDFCLGKAVVPITIPPYSSTQIKWFDLSIFEVMKRLMTHLHTMKEAKSN